MTQYYALLQTRTHALILEHRFAAEGIPCELAYMPREIMTDLCNLGVKFSENVFPAAMNIIRRSALPNCRVYREYISANGSCYEEVSF